MLSMIAAAAPRSPTAHLLESDRAKHAVGAADERHQLLEQVPRGALGGIELGGRRAAILVGAPDELAERDDAEKRFACEHARRRVEHLVRAMRCEEPAIRRRILDKP